MSRISPQTVLQAGAQQPADVAPASLSPTDLAELMTAFNDVTSKLERTHAQLRAEVSRLNGELSEANEALQRSKRLAALGEMAAGISHEIRNPLGSIRLYANMLQDDLADRPEERQIVDKIGRAVRGLDEIVGDVLSFARELKASFHRNNLQTLVEHAIELSIAETSSQITLEGFDEIQEIECDGHLIQQALVNVLRNAGQANLAAGNSGVRIECEMGEALGDGRAEECVSLCIHDEGDGIPGSVIERMFNPFFTTRAAGTGLGLAIVHRIVDAHRGRVEVGNHASGPGAWVRLQLPVLQPIVVTRVQGSGGEGPQGMHPLAGASPCVMK